MMNKMFKCSYCLDPIHVTRKINFELEATYIMHGLLMQGFSLKDGFFFGAKKDREELTDGTGVLGL